MPVIVEDHAAIGIDAGWIVRRIMAHLPPNALEGLNEVRLLGSNKECFARYSSREGVIEIFLEELLKGFSPILLKILYPYAYTIVGMALCHELDHHIHRNNSRIDREAIAEANVMKYMYPSIGIFKPLVQLISLCGRARRGAKARKQTG